MSALRIRCVDLIVTICFAALPMSGCGDSKSDGANGSGSSSDKSAGGTTSSSMKPDATPGAGGASPSTGGAPAGSIPCGTIICAAPANSRQTACCQDQFAGICGVMNRSGCTNPPKPPPKGCPALPMVRGFMGAACCTTAGQCGIQSRGFGQPCVDVATAAAQAMKMGVNVGTVPPPTSCTPGDGGA